MTLLLGLSRLVADESSFVARFECHVRELHVHCYRMLGSFDEADDLVQQTRLLAWRQRERLGNDAWFRAWLYRIATNACFDALASTSRRAPATSSADLHWLQPYPDRLLDGAVTRGTIELAYLAAIQQLPPRQRAALVLRDVLGWSMRETAGLLDTTMVAANSVLQRARATLQLQLPRRSDAGRRDGGTVEPDERLLLERYIDAHDRADAAAAVALLRDDVRITMPTHQVMHGGVMHEGRGAVARLLDGRFRAKSAGDWRLVPTAANRQPAAAGYLRAPLVAGHRASKLDVLRIEGGAIAEITSFDSRLFPAFGLPSML